MYIYIVRFVFPQRPMLSSTSDLCYEEPPISNEDNDSSSNSSTKLNNAKTK